MFLLQLFSCIQICFSTCVLSSFAGPVYERNHSSIELIVKEIETNPCDRSS